MARLSSYRFILCLAVFLGCDSGSEPEISIEEIVVGSGALAEGRDVVTVHYTGMFTDGRVFDSSVDRGPLTFELGTGILAGGQGRLIPGFVQGVSGMRVGGTRRITIPPELAYGRSGFGSIPGNTTIVFEVELLEVEDGPQS